MSKNVATLSRDVYYRNPYSKQRFHTLPYVKYIKCPLIISMWLSDDLSSMGYWGTNLRPISQEVLKKYIRNMGLENTFVKFLLHLSGADELLIHFCHTQPRSAYIFPSVIATSCGQLEPKPNYVRQTHSVQCDRTFSVRDPNKSRSLMAELTPFSPFA